MTDRRCRAGRSTVFGWRSPWTGDEADPIPRRYWLWYRLYRRTRQARHLAGRHDWRLVGVTEFPDDPVYVQRHWYCDWCGARRPT